MVGATPIEGSLQVSRQILIPSISILRNRVTAIKAKQTKYCGQFGLFFRFVEYASHDIVRIVTMSRKCIKMLIFLKLGIVNLRLV